MTAVASLTHVQVVIDHKTAAIAKFKVLALILFFVCKCFDP